jgi:hypothetical protein
VLDSQASSAAESGCSNPASYLRSLCFLPIPKDKHDQKLISEFAVEALDERILPGITRLDVHGIAPKVPQPVLDSIGDELRAIVAPDVLRLTTDQEEIIQCLYDLL